MTDNAAGLRAQLLSTDNTMPGIQSSAGSMMSFYDRSATAAVSEWRNALQTCDASQLMPLLYVANEVLQTSKRNRGNRFLEAFSPVLGSSLIFICQRDGGVVEKVRRTVKIWGDRRIFSVRFVGEILGGIDSFRGGETMGSFSPSPAASPAAPTEPSPASSSSPAPPRRSSPSDSISGGGSGGGSYSDDDDDDDFLGGDAAQNLLGVDVSIGNVIATPAPAASSSAEHKPFGSAAGKRRRSVSPVPPGGQLPRSSSSASLNAAGNGDGTTPGPGSATKKSRTKALSTQTFLELVQSVVSLDEKYKSSLGVLESVPPAYLADDNGAAMNVDDLVGDELTDAYRKVCASRRTVRRERRGMHSVAGGRREAEKKAERYVRWLRRAAEVDEEEIRFVRELEGNLDALNVCHEDAKKLREKRRDDEARTRAEEESLARRAAEEEERKRMLDDVKREGESKPGMVWNQQLREYQYLHDPTQDSWRD